MATRAFAFNNTGDPISNVGNSGLVVYETDSTIDYSQDYGGIKWWEGPEENIGYVIAIPDFSSNQPTPPGVYPSTANVKFKRTKEFTDQAFIDLVNNVTQMSFTAATDASTWLSNNGIFTTYGMGVTPITGQTSLVLTTVDGSPNWHYVIFDFINNLITTPYDMGLTTSDYNNTNINYTNLGGYVVTLHNSSDYSNRKYYFISANGVLIDTYTSNTGTYNDGSDVDIQFVIDYDNYILKYFDGLNVYTRDFSSITNNSFDVTYYYDAGGSDGGLLTYWDDGTTGHVENNYQGNIITLKSYNIADYTIDALTYSMSNYTLLVQKHANTSYYYRIDIVDNQTGSLLQRIPLDDYNYTNYDQYFYGTGKTVLIFSNYSDTTVPWRTVYYDGVRDVAFTADQSNDDNYTSYETYYTTNYPYLNDGNPSESFFINFYGNYNSYNSFINTYGYYKIYSFYDGCNSPSIYTLNDTGTEDKGISDSYATSNHFYRLISTGLTTLEILVLGEPTEQIIETDIIIYDNASNGGMDSLDRQTIGDNLFLVTYSGNSNSESNAYVFGKISGTTYGMRANKHFDNNSLNWYRGSGYILVVDQNNSQYWYFNDSVSNFTSMDYLSSLYSNNTDSCYRPPYYEKRPTYVFFSQDTYEAYVLTKNNLSPKVTFGQNNGNFALHIGVSHVVYVYNNNTSGAVVIEIYDLSLTRTQQIVTSELILNNVEVVSDRYWIQTTDISGNYVFYVLTPTTYQTINLPNSSFNGPYANDFVY